MYLHSGCFRFVALKHRLRSSSFACIEDYSGVILFSDNFESDESISVSD